MRRLSLLHQKRLTHNLQYTANHNLSHILLLPSPHLLIPPPRSQTQPSLHNTTLLLPTPILLSHFMAAYPQERQRLFLFIECSTMMSLETHIQLQWLILFLLPSLPWPLQQGPSLGCISHLQGPLQCDFQVHILMATSLCSRSLSLNPLHIKELPQHNRRNRNNINISTVIT